MDETAANGQPSPPDVWDDEGSPPPKGEPGEIFLKLDPDTAAALAETAWVDEQCNAGRWDEFNGEYIAVAEKQLLGHSRDLGELYEHLARNYPALSQNRIVITYIDRGFTC